MNGKNKKELVKLNVRTARALSKTYPNKFYMGVRQNVRVRFGAHRNHNENFTLFLNQRATLSSLEVEI